MSGTLPSCGDPKTISSLRTEHYRFLAISIWVWTLCTKYDVWNGHFDGTVDNSVVIMSVNGGIDKFETVSQFLTTDYDLWQETLHILKTIPVTTTLQRVKGHQDNMYAKVIQGPLNWDAF